MSEYMKIFISFFKIGLFTFGGGAAMMPFFRQELIIKNSFISEEELVNYYALGQCTPGIIAVNVATFTGYKIKGICGACLATLAIILPSIIIILLLAGILNTLAENNTIKHIFSGIRLGVVALVFNEVLKLFKRNITTTYQKGIFISIVIVIFTFHLSPIAAILFASVIGSITFLKKRLK